MDVYTTRLVVITLGILACVGIIGTVVLQAVGHEPPGSLATFTGMCIGFLVGLPVKTITNPADPARSP